MIEKKNSVNNFKKFLGGEGIKNVEKPLVKKIDQTKFLFGGKHVFKILVTFDKCHYFYFGKYRGWGLQNLKINAFKRN